MPLPIDPTRSTLPPVAQFLAEVALQRQTGLLGLDKTPGAAPAPLPLTDPSAPPPSATSPSPPGGPLPAPADKASISAQAREQLGAGFEPSRGALGASGAQGGGPGARLSGSAAAPLPLPSTLTGTGAARAQAAATVAGATWPAGGLSAPLLRMVSALIAQLTQPPQGAAPQRVLAAQPWPLDLAHALESGAVEGDTPLLQTWLVRQGSVQAADGARGFALTLRAPVAWLAGQAPAPAAPPAGAAPLLVPFGGSAAALQSGVLALVLQGAEASAARTSALLVLDFQPQLPAAVYGRDMLQARLDPWTQMAVLQNSGQVPTDEERARHHARGGQTLCDTLGCPYLARAACVQPFCLAMHGLVPPPEPVGPVF